MDASFYILTCKCGEHIEGNNQALCNAGWTFKTWKRGEMKGKTTYMCRECTRKYIDKNLKRRA